MMIGDVTVVGLDTSTVPLLDIGMDVPHQAVVTIPADRATLSKDLWRAISQRRLFQLHAGPATQVAVRPIPPPVAPDVWQAKCRTLEAENAQLRARVAELETRDRSLAPDTEVASKIDEILSLLRSGRVAVTAGSVPVARAESRGVVEVDVPTFIPSEIKKDFEGRITEVETSSSQNSALDSAASALRKLRRGQ